MKLTNLNLSFPVKSYKAHIEHFTPRKSTAIEWVVLQSAEKIQENPKYGDVSIASFFTGVLKISDPNLLVRPCISNLIDVGALESSGEIYDDVDLAEVHMRELRLTNDGRIMQQRGLLPGTVMGNDVVFLHNLFDQSIFIKKGNLLSESPTGVKVSAFDNIENVSMPTQIVRNYLLNPSNSKLFPWITANTEIRDLYETPSENSTIYWQNQLTSVDILGNGKVSVGKYGVDVLDKVVDFLELDSRNYEGSRKQLDELKLDDVDASYSKIVVPKNLIGTIQKEIKDCSIALINTDLCEIDLHDLYNDFYRIIVRYGGTVDADSEFIAKTKLLVISIPKSSELDNILGSTVFVNKFGQYQLNKVGIYGESSKAFISLALKPKKMSLDFKTSLEIVVENYKEKCEDVLFILPMLGLNDRFVNTVVELANHFQNEFESKIDFLSRISSKSQKYFGKTFVSGNVECELLFRNWNLDNLSTDDVIQNLQHLLEYKYVTDNPDLLKAGAQLMLNAWNVVENFESYQKFLRFIESCNPLKNILKGPEISKLFAKKCFVDLLLQSFGELPGKLPSIIGLEQCMQNLQEAYRSLQKELERIGYERQLTAVEKKNVLLGANGGLSALNNLLARNRAAKDDLLKQLRDMASKYNLPVYDFDDMGAMEKQHYEALFNSFSLVQEIGKEITPYLGLWNYSYDEVYVTDTCAIMHHPEILDAFKKNKSAFIVPKEVIRELDGLKKNPETALQAQAAAKKINENMNAQKNGNKWLFIEDGDLSLLPMEYRGDNQKIKGDDLILSVALKFKIRDPILLVDDVNFSNKAYGEYLKQMTSEEFMKNIQKNRS